jgi:Family of unknown function (DUF6134)
MITLKPAVLLGFYILWASLSEAAVGTADPPSRSWHFTVLLDGKRIGEHDFAIAPQGAESAIDTEAHFRVKAAFISLYQYDHQDHEVWRDGCLVRLNSHTRDNGKSFAVQGRLQAQAFEVHGARGATTLPACVQTFAYWDQRLLTGSRLLNSQTGEFQPVILTPDGMQVVRVRGRMIPAQRYSLRAPKLDIQLWYAGSGDWVALESRLESGRILRYEIQ